MALTRAKTGALARGLIGGLAVCLVATPAHAYLDPATGSMILQGLLAGLAGLLAVLRFYRDQVKAFFRKLMHGGKLPEENTGGTETESKAADKGRE